MTCPTCHDSTHEAKDHFDVAFTNPVTGLPYDVPPDLVVAATRICRAYNIKGIADPMYVANVIAKETGRGDGESHFTP